MRLGVICMDFINITSQNPIFCLKIFVIKKTINDLPLLSVDHSSATAQQRPKTQPNMF